MPATITVLTPDDLALVLSRLSLVESQSAANAARIAKIESGVVPQPPQPPAPDPITVSISPTSASVKVGESVRFRATTNGTKGVEWRIFFERGPSSSVGTIDQSGLFTASNMPADVIVKATSLDDSSKSATATVTITAPVAPPTPDPDPNPPQPPPPQPPQVEGWITTPHDKIPDFGGKPTISSVKNGNWSDVTTWDKGRLPADNDIPLVAHNVVYDVASNARLNCVAVKGGLFLKPDVNTRLVTQHFIGYEGSHVTFGTEDAPVQDNVSFDLIIADVPINLAQDPSQYGNGLIILGKWEMCGCGAGIPKPIIRLTENPQVGSTTLKLSLPAVNWKVGGEVVLPGNWRRWWNHNEIAYTTEVLKITSVSADLKTITFSPPLKYGHPGCTEFDGTTSKMLHVAYLTRNITIRSENPSGTRGHIFTTMSADVDVCHARIDGMGRTTDKAAIDDTTYNQDGSVLHTGTNQRGRYAFHLHHVHGSMDPDMLDMGYRGLVEGLVITNALHRALSIHGTHYFHIFNNIVLNSESWPIFGEDGSETEDLIEGNFICEVRGEGYWFAGPNVRLRNNIAARVEHPDYDATAFVYNSKMIGLVQIPVAIDSMSTVTADPNAMTILENVGNEAYASSIGGTAWWLGTKEEYPVAGAVAGAIKDFTVWNVWQAAWYGYATQGLTFDNPYFRGPFAAENSPPAGVWFSDYYTKDLVIKGGSIKGFIEGVECPKASEGITLIDDVDILADQCVVTINPWGVAGTPWAKPKGVLIKDCLLSNLGDRGSGHWHPPALILRIYNVAQKSDGITKDTCEVINFQQVVGDNFKVYHKEQRADFICPATGLGDDHNVNFIGCPEAGLTNTQALAKYGVCVAGEIAPANAVARDGIIGLVAKVVV